MSNEGHPVIMWKSFGPALVLLAICASLMSGCGHSQSQSQDSKVPTPTPSPTPIPTPTPVIAFDDPKLPAEVNLSCIYSYQLRELDGTLNEDSYDQNLDLKNQLEEIDLLMAPKLSGSLHLRSNPTSFGSPLTTLISSMKTKDDEHQYLLQTSANLSHINLNVYETRAGAPLAQYLEIGCGTHTTTRTVTSWDQTASLAASCKTSTVVGSKSVIAVTHLPAVGNATQIHVENHTLIVERDPITHAPTVRLTLGKASFLVQLDDLQTAMANFSATRDREAEPKTLECLFKAIP